MDYWWRQENPMVRPEEEKKPICFYCEHETKDLFEDEAERWCCPKCRDDMEESLKEEADAWTKEYGE